MAKVSKRKVATIKGMLEIDGDKILMHVEDVAEPYVLSEYVKDFDGLAEVAVSFSYKMDEA
jgi:hypothetical protein